MINKRAWRDIVNDISVNATSKSMAWLLIRVECKEKNLKAPLMKDVIEVR